MIVGALAGAAAVLLIIAGAAKIRTPGPAAAMIMVLVPPLGPGRRARRAARAAGAVELAAGATTLLDGGRWSVALLGGCYLVLAGVALRLLRGGQPTSCGCFGAADGVVGPAHLVLDLAGLGAAAGALIDPFGSLAGLYHAGVLTGLIATAQAGLLAALGYLSITALPALTSARRTAEGNP